MKLLLATTSCNLGDRIITIFTRFLKAHLFDFCSSYHLRIHFNTFERVPGDMFLMDASILFWKALWSLVIENM